MRPRTKSVLQLYRVPTSRVKGICFVRAFSESQAQHFIKNAFRSVLKLVASVYIEDQLLQPYTDEDVVHNYGLSASLLPQGRCAFRILDGKVESLSIG
ncbi:MAG: hypothetical protein M1586_02530 [Patescibacteria group bacterium]|nr:hypothetical protein [Patescibacteria group bacterium]MCL5262148.1 hypothetical protein [Patescibacteria group bacterium]